MIEPVEIENHVRDCAKEKEKVGYDNRKPRRGSVLAMSQEEIPYRLQYAPIVVASCWIAVGESVALLGDGRGTGPVAVMSEKLVDVHSCGVVPGSRGT